MIVVGIHNTGINSSAAIAIDGSLKFGYLEERLSRHKHDKSFPHKALEKILSLSNITYEDVDIFAISWNPAINIADRYRAGFSDWPAYPGNRFSSNPNHILPLLENKTFSTTEQIFNVDGQAPYRISYVSHHLTHAATAYFASGFGDAVIFTCDGYGEKASTCWFHGEKQNITQIGQVDFPHSIGMFYSTITEYLGFRPFLDEWKVMGASAYGNPEIYLDDIRKLFKSMEGVKFELNLEYFQFYNFDSKTTYTEKLVDLLGANRNHEDNMEQRHYDIAAATQRVTEEYFLSALEGLKRKTASKNICLSGGSVMNSVVNGIIADSGIFDNVFVPFAPDDSGNSIGAALWVSSQNNLSIDRKSAAKPFLGQKYSDDEILRQFTLSKLEPEKPDNIYKTTAELIADGKIIGWFQGSMEFGQRALGCRSILADPRNENMKDLINSAVKFRESFRPFAPAILEDFTDQWFEVSRPILSPYMEKVIKIKADLAHIVPAIVHADGSCRLQTVTKELTPDFYILINEFYKKTEIPILLNTSFNINNEPIVESPADAIKTFFSSGLDALIIGPYLLEK
jgi:carbamoyltransferase